MKVLTTAGREQNVYSVNKRKIGSLYEEAVCQVLVREGMHIAERNFRCRRGEIDIVAYDGRYLVFVEVKYRSGISCGNALDAIDYRKQYVICRVADYYLYSHHMPINVPVRFDAASVGPEGIRIIRNAFAYIPGRI